jgi:hypothetical protein
MPLACAKAWHPPILAERREVSDIEHGKRSASMKLCRIAVFMCSLLGLLVAVVLESKHWLPNNYRRAATALLLLGPGVVGWWSSLFYLREVAKEFKGTYEGSLRNLVGRFGIRITDRSPVCSAAALILFGGAAAVLAITIYVIKSLFFGD